MTSLAIMSIPVVIYAIVIRLVERVSGREIAKRLGLTLGKRRYYLWALGLALVGIVLSVLVSRLIPSSLLDHETLAQSRFVGQALTAPSLASALVFGMLETGLGEELFFRGLIAGWLGRRAKLWTANVIQAAVFTLPHLLLLTMDLSLWPIALLAPFAAGLVQGWLRLESGSIIPGWLVHGIGNVAGAIAMMDRV